MKTQTGLYLLAVLVAVSLIAPGCQHASRGSCGLAAGPLCTASALGTPLAGLEQLKPGKTMRASSSDVNWQNGNGDARPIAPGKTLTIAELEGPGVINHIWNTIAPGERGYSRLYVIRMYWDGEEEPSVECPIGDFFAIGHGIDEPFQSLPIVISSNGRARNCYWPMPFRKSARITVTNEGTKPLRALYWYVDWQQLPSLPPDTAYFHAMYRQEFPTVMGQNYLIADIEGRGHYVGTVMNIRQLTGSWYGEGDDFFFIDGESEPRLRGTGSEDYFCDAWGFRKFDGPYYGVPVWSNFEPYNKITAYRWHLADPVSFNQSLRVEIEHKGVTFNEDGSVKSGFEERSDDFASVAYWYQLEPHKPYPPLPPAYDRLYVRWDKISEGESLLEGATASEGPVEQQDGGAWSGNAQLFWRPQQQGQSLELSFEVAQAGHYDMLVLLTHSWDYGIAQLELDGKPLGRPIDLFNPSVVVNEHYLGPGMLQAGPHTLRVVNQGKAAVSKGYFFGLDGFLLTPRIQR